MSKFIRYFPKYIKDMLIWKKQKGQITHFYPVFTDYNGNYSTAKGHYFHQDLLVATYIYKKNPVKHIDIGSRVDGFVAHVATFRKIEIFDLRSLKTNHQNIVFKQMDLTKSISGVKTDSLSCLHSLEHFGLGRYSDDIDVNGFEKGINNLIKILEPEGSLYISFPISKKDEVHFNAHRVFNPMSVLNLRSVKKYLKLEKFDYVDDSGDLIKDVNIYKFDCNLNHGLGIYSFKKF